MLKISDFLNPSAVNELVNKDLLAKISADQLAGVMEVLPDSPPTQEAGCRAGTCITTALRTINVTIKSAPDKRIQESGELKRISDDIAVCVCDTSKLRFLLLLLSRTICAAQPFRFDDISSRHLTL